MSVCICKNANTGYRLNMNAGKFAAGFVKSTCINFVRF